MVVEARAVDAVWDGLAAALPTPACRLAANGTVLFANAAAEQLPPTLQLGVGRTAQQERVRSALATLSVEQPTVSLLADDLGANTGAWLVRGRFELGQLADAVALHHDILSPRAGSEMASHLARQRQRLLDAAPIPLHSINREGQLVAANRAWFTLLGYEAHQVIGQSVGRFLTEPSMRFATEVVLADFWATTRSRGRRYQLRRADDTLLDVEINCNATLDETGREISISAIRDLTSELRAHVALEESEQHFRRLVEHGGALIATHDLDGRILTINHQTARQVGLTDVDLRGRRLDDWLSPQRRGNFTAYLSRLVQHGEDQDHFHVVLGEEPRTFFYKATLDGDVATVYAHDVTESEQARSDLKRREQILAAIAWSAARFLRGSGWREGLDSVVARLGAAADVSRCYVFQVEENQGQLLASQRSEWVAAGIQPQIDNPELQALDLVAAGFGRWVAALRADEPVHGATQEFPEAERELLLDQQIASLLVAPIRALGKLWGFIGLDDCHVPRTWSSADVEVLVTAANLLGATIDQEAATTALRLSEERFRVLVENIPGVVYMCLNDSSYSMLYLSSEVEALTGYAVARFLNRDVSFVSLYHPDDGPGVRALVDRAVAARRSYRLQYRLRHASGEWRWIEEHGQGVFDHSGTLSFLEGTLFDVTDRTRTEAELQHQALHDTLTSLPNRALFHDRVHTSIQRLRRNPDDLFAVVMVDMDRFKVINDSLGPGIADRLLIAIGQRLAACVDAGDTAARLGGDEFGLLLDVLEDTNDALRVVERLHRTLSSTFQIGSHEIYCTASIGITLSHPRYESAEEMLRDADTAMYRAKAKGPGQHVIFDPRMHERALERLALESQLRRAFERDELLVWYQPIRDLGTNSIVSLEALVRWSHPERGLVSPDSFLEIARDAGLMQLIATVVLRSACRDIAALRLEHPHIGVNVNLDASDISWPDLVPELGRILAATKLPPAALTIEITEHALIRQSEATARVLHELRGLGVAISIDDFGTGYSSLSILHELPVTGLKLDRSFLARGETGRPIATAVSGLARSLGLELTAEGVETEAQLAILLELGYPRAQGYLIGRPSPLAELVASWGPKGT